MYNKAFIIGKFLPPHLGHLSLIRSAKSLAKEVYVAVEQIENEPLNVHTRAQLLSQDVSSGVHVVPFLYSLPPSPDHVSNKEEFWKNWQQAISETCPDMDVLVSSDDYGYKLAKDQNVPWVKVDRSSYPMSATHLKEKFWGRTEHLTPSVKAYFTKRIALVGDESTGKSFLANMLAQRYKTVCVPEMAEYIIKAKQLNPNHLTQEDLLSFVQSQQASRTGLLPLAQNILFEDSNELTTCVYAKLFGFVDLSQQLEQLFVKNAPHHTIVALKKGSHFEPSPHRLDPSQKYFSIEQEMIDLLKKHNCSYSTIEGDWELRTQKACDQVSSLVSFWKQLDFAHHCKLAMGPQSSQEDQPVAPLSGPKAYYKV